MHFDSGWRSFFEYFCCYLAETILGSSGISALSILFEEPSRRKEIGYFVAAKALRSVYKIMKRRGIVSIKREFLVMHVSLMGLLYYVYCEHPKLLKYKNLFDIVFGD